MENNLKILPDVLYEIRLLLHLHIINHEKYDKIRTDKDDKKVNIIIFTSLMESYLIHLRNIYDFLLNDYLFEEKYKKKKPHKYDVLASYFFPKKNIWFEIIKKWKLKNNIDIKTIAGKYDKIHKSLAHISYKRMEIEAGEMRDHINPLAHSIIKLLKQFIHSNNEFTIVLKSTNKRISKELDDLINQILNFKLEVLLPKSDFYFNITWNNLIEQKNDDSLIDALSSKTASMKQVEEFLKNKEEKPS